ncbi:hypothetical protein LZB30_09100, partial [Campylobacter jejuni]|uniref:hypothetical protein n=1 Tax=Campylobacter jejuni TaxID=197 RepID=UPI001F096758
MEGLGWVRESKGWGFQQSLSEFLEKPVSLAQSKSSFYFLYFLHIVAGPFWQIPRSIAGNTQESQEILSLVEELPAQGSAI